MCSVCMTRVCLVSCSFGMGHEHSIGSYAIIVEYINASLTAAGHLQFLHCIQFDEGVEGGQSLFLDAMEAARYFRDHYSEHFEVCGISWATVGNADGRCWPRG